MEGPVHSNMNKNQTFDIYISYDPNYINVVRPLAKKLKEVYNLRVWIDYDQINNGTLTKHLYKGFLLFLNLILTIFFIKFNF